MSKRIVLIAARSPEGAIGRAGQIPWHLPHDFAHFKTQTMGHTLVMGRATWDSIGRPLPGRATVVLTRDPDWTAGEHAERVHVAHTLQEALGIAAALPGDVFIAGGGQVYAEALPYATHLVLTEVAHTVKDGDAFFPAVDPAQWEETRREAGEDLEWVWARRRTPAS